MHINLNPFPAFPYDYWCNVLGRVDVSFPTTSQTLESHRCHGFKNYPQCTSSTPPVIFETLPSCDFQVFVSRYENETSTRPN
ncbi:MAG: hypothetical protein R3B45_03570 [Bdellovibrionota bacterium]